MMPLKRTARLRILVSAYACSPYQGSEPGVGWGFVHELARHHQLEVIVEDVKFRTEIERWQKENPSDPAAQIRFHYIEKKRNKWLRKIWPPSYYYYYRNWQKKALKLAKKQHSKQSFDLVHQLTMVGFREPGYLWRLPIPFVWGPFGGAGHFPLKFLPYVGLHATIYYLCYNLINSLHVLTKFRVHLAAHRAGIGLIAATNENRQIAQKYWLCDATVMSEVGMSGELCTPPKSRKLTEPLRLVWSGQHIPRKALNLGLDGLSYLPPDCHWELHVLGKGKQTEQWQEKAKRLGIADKCHFHGSIPHKKALKITSQAHVALITSLRDLTSTVTVEALGMGLPVVAPSHCGFSDIIDEKCGFLVPVNKPRAMVLGITNAVLRLHNDESLRFRMAQCAYERAEMFTWYNKCNKLNILYRTCLDHSESNVSFDA